MDCMIAPAIAERAIAWLVALQTPPVTPQTLAAWRQWRASNPEHERAWQRLAAFSAYPDDPLPVDMTVPSALLAAPESAGLHRRQVFMSLAVLATVGGLAGWRRRYGRHHHKTAK